MSEECNPTDSLYIFDCYEVIWLITFLASKCCIFYIWFSDFATVIWKKFNVEFRPPLLY